MALDPKAEAAIALHRFGLGPRAGSIAAIASDPRGALIAELDRAGASRAPEMKEQSGPASPAPPRPASGPGLPQQIYLAEAKARIDAALAAEIGFVERLVWFWSNHFCVSADKGNVRQIC